MNFVIKILNEMCYTDLVYARINKKLKINLSNEDIEKLIKQTIKDSDQIEHIGKNYYVFNHELHIRVTINANNYRVITVDKLI